MRVLIITHFSRGDIQPSAAVACRWTEVEHRVHSKESASTLVDVLESLE